MCNPMSNHVKRHDSNECKVGCSPLAFVVDSGAQCVQLRVDRSIFQSVLMLLKTLHCKALKLSMKTAPQLKVLNCLHRFMAMP